MNTSVVEGKIVMCEKYRGDNNGGKITELFQIKQGFPGLDEPHPSGVIISTPQTDVSRGIEFADAIVNTLDFDILKNYKASNRSATARILKSEDIKVAAPIVASFSSRGPNSVVPEILKPDITAPGVEIIAAGHVHPYAIMSGTSMSCPHVAAAAAYVKSFHPDWSPSALKSALMTTAWPMDPTATGNEEAEFGYGSGHLDPVKAGNPGLVYETSKYDYLALLLNLGYDNTTIRDISGDPTRLDGITKLASPTDLNYPSMMAVVAPFDPFQVQFKRTVTNVGIPNSLYKSTVKVLSTKANVTLSVTPSELQFSSLKEIKSFVVEVSGQLLSAGKFVSASLEWFDGSHRVRSPIVIHSSVSALSLSSAKI